MNKLTKLLLIIGGIATAAAVTAAAAATVVITTLNSPLTLVSRGITNSCEALSEHPVVELMSDAAEDGSAELSVELDQLIASTLGYLGIDLTGTVDLKIYNDRDHDRTAAVAQLELNGQQMLDAAILATGDDIIVTSDSLLADEVYGINLESASDKFGNSVFGPEGDFDLGIDSIDRYTDLLQADEETKEDLETITEELAAVLMKSLKEHAVITKENEELVFAGETTAVTTVEIVLDSEAFTAVMRDVIAYLRESELVRKYVEQYSGSYESELRAQYESDKEYWAENYGIETFEEYCREIHGVDPDLTTEFYSGLDELDEELEDFDEFERVTSTFYITKLRKELVGVDLRILYGEASAKTAERFSLRFGPSMKELNEVELRIISDGSEALLHYEVTSNDETEYNARLTAESYGEEVFSLAMYWNKESSDAALRFALEENYLEVTGLLTLDREYAQFDLCNINVDGATMPLNAMLRINASDEFPEHLEVADYTEILDLTSGDLEQLAGRVASRLMNKVYLLDDSVLWILQMLLG